jgi:dTDP-glucose 4,6-dehydratase
VIPAADLDHILAHTAPLWRELAGSRIFITGGTGFFGIWLLEAIAAANDTLGIGLGATVLSRNPARFAGEHPRLAGRAEFEWLEGHIEDFSFPAEPCDYVIHLATPSAAELSAGGTELSLATLLGTQRVLQFARTGNARRLLLASSGAVYGQQPAELSHIPETYPGAPNLQRATSSYGEIKRMAELMCVLTPEVDCVIARGFSFFGPGLPLTEKFAMGSFIRDALAGGPIRIRGDGSPVRSYLYAADLVIWLLTLMLKGKPNHPYNVGSDQAVSLAQLAQQVADTIPGTRIDIGRSPTAGAPEAYVPDIRRARDELGLDVLIPLSSGLRRTVDWARQPSPAPR